MFEFLAELGELISSSIEKKHKDDQYEVARDFRWQLANTGVDYEEFRAHLDPTYWTEDEEGSTNLTLILLWAMCILIYIDEVRPRFHHSVANDYIGFGAAFLAAVMLRGLIRLILTCSNDDRWQEWRDRRTKEVMLNDRKNNRIMHKW